MLSSVLNSERAVQINIAIVRAFVKLRELLATHKDLARKIDRLEAKQKDHAVLLALVAKDIETLATSVKKEFKKLEPPRRRKPRRAPELQNQRPRPMLRTRSSPRPLALGERNQF